MNQPAGPPSGIQILHTESTLGLGGQELRVFQEVVGMRQRGHGVCLVVPPGSQLAVLAREEGIEVLPLPMSVWRWGLLVYQFIKIFSKIRVDILNTHGSIDSWTASIAARLSRKPPIIIRTRHKSTPVSKTFRHQLLYANLPHRVITTGESVRKELIQKANVAQSDIVSIPTGVDLTKFYPQNQDLMVKRELKIPEGHHVVGTIAFLRDYKGVDIFLKAASLVVVGHPSVHFLVIGEGPERENLERLTRELGLKGKVCFPGYRDDIPRLLSIFDIVVLASLSAEGLPQVLTQALAMERAVVATSVGSIQEVIRDNETGLLVHPGDERELASTILRLIQSSSLRERLGRAGRALVSQHYSLESMLDKTESLYGSLMTQT